MIERDQIRFVFLQADMLHHIADLDRSEHITRIFRYAKGGLAEVEVDHRVPRWSPEGDGL